MRFYIKRNLQTASNIYYPLDKPGASMMHQSTYNTGMFEKNNSKER